MKIGQLGLPSWVTGLLGQRDEKPGQRTRLKSPSRRTSSGVGELDTVLVWVIAALLAFGLVMVYSASIALPDSVRFAKYQSTHFMWRHLFAISLGGVVGIAAFSVPTRVWQKLAPIIFLAGLVLLVLVLIPGLGKVVYGARRWISLGFINLQPSELMKLAVVLYASDFVIRKQSQMQSLSKGFMPMGAAVGFVGILLLLEPDMGAFMVIAVIAMGVLFLGGVNGRLFSGLIVVAVTVFSSIIYFSPWRRERIFAYLDPFEPTNALGKGYQLSHSLIAFGRGEIFGVGLGGSIEKLHYLPEAHTDFLLAVIGEELGLVAVVAVIFGFYWITKRGFEIGRQAIVLDRPFAGMIAKGIALWIGSQALINMGVNVGALPTKGLTLPLMSYGGTGILVNMAAVALLLRVDWENRRLMRGVSV
jgi:cell division protein FtsW